MTSASPPPLSPELSHRLREGAIRGVIWGFIGILFGTLFITVYRLAEEAGTSIPPVMIAGTLSAGLGALIYGSMRLAVLIAAFCAPLSVLFLVLGSEISDPVTMVLKTGSLGAFIGSLYGVFARSSRVNRADAKTLAGLTAGIIVSSIYMLFAELLKFELPTLLLTALFCPTIGLLYTRLAEPFIPRFKNLLPRAADGALVGFGVAVFIGFGMWLVAGHIDIQVTGTHTATVDAILTELPAAAIGGMLGGAAGGFIGGVAGFAWQDL